MEEPKVATEVAEQEFERWLSAMGLEEKTDPKVMSPDDLDEYRKLRHTMVSAIMRGNVAFDDARGLVFRPQVGDTSEIVFPEPEWGFAKAQDKVKDGESMSKTFAILARWTGNNSSRFEKLKNRDASVVQAIFKLFLSR